MMGLVSVSPFAVPARITARLPSGLVTFAMLAGVPPFAAAEDSPFADAIAVWHMADSRDLAKTADRLIVRGDVKLGISLEVHLALIQREIP